MFFIKSKEKESRSEKQESRSENQDKRHIGSLVLFNVVFLGLFF
jgi:hypothetical protein